MTYSLKESALPNEVISEVSEGKEEIRQDVFDNPGEAQARAKEIGCSGIHTHDENGKTIFMPCETHEEYEELTGRELSGYKPKKPKKKEDCSCHDEKAKAGDLKVGDMVSWGASGGRARGKIQRIITSGSVAVPDTDFEITGSEDNPGALIRVYRDDEPTDTIVGHRFSTLRKIKSFDFDLMNENINIQTEIKAYNDEDEDEEYKEYGYFEGYGSIFGNKDLGNDVIEKGAFINSLKKRKAKNVKLLYQHKSDMPIGVFESIKEDDKGLYVKGKLALKTQAGAEAYELLKMGALDGLSIGFRVKPESVSYDKRANKRIIKEVDLMEISLVTFPMNPKATISSVKGEDISVREWEKGLRDAFQLSRSEAKVAAVAVTKSFSQRDADDNAELVDAINKLTLTLKS